ncbi:hypothetical protein F0562_025882 [Nyssa sinensis]|uniref:Ubiquitin thioesterase OTU n=1 Tax=Nyssa sinensis TaxID=561372 RepID=A0A5J5B9Q9_9ASTE|nr:hypothetical protein F0562_025882 [Nyssa sinensis]
MLRNPTRKHDVVEFGLAGDNVLADGFELSDGGLSGGAGNHAPFGIFPRRLSPRALMFDYTDAISSNENDKDLANYRVTGVPADGRCLFRAITHVACLRNGEEAPDENRQRELADELRAQVVDELLKRREETEWFIEGDFDTNVKGIQQPYVWGGEPELLMASHVLKTAISVFMIDRSSGGLVNIAN